MSWSSVVELEIILEIFALHAIHGHDRSRKKQTMQNICTCLASLLNFETLKKFPRKKYAYNMRYLFPKWKVLWEYEQNYKAAIKFDRCFQEKNKFNASIFQFLTNLESFFLKN